MRIVAKPVTYLFPGQFGRLQLMSSLVWCATIIGVAITAKYSGQFIYELLVLFVGFNLSWSAIEATARRSQREADAAVVVDGTSSSHPGPQPS